MKHTVEELIRIAHEYFPQGIEQRDPRYTQTPEMDRQRAARVLASARYNTWKALLNRLDARFPQDQFPGVESFNHCLFLQSPAAGANLDRCFTGELWLPVRSTREKRHWLEFLISFVVPYFTVYSSRVVLLDGPAGAGDIDVVRSFDLSADEVPFAKAIAEEIKSSFPGHEPISPEVGLTIVPDVDAGGHMLGEATVFTCLFSDSW